MAATNLEEFTAAVAAFGKSAPSRLNLVQRRLALQGLTSLVNRTPVDTGRARGNWQVTIDAPAEGFTDRKTPVGTTVIREGSFAIGASRPTNERPYSAIYITNNLPYIEALENGHSKQAPAGMLAVTFADLQSQLTAGAD